MAVQGVSGVAKMSSKSAVKLLAPQEDGDLFRWVAALAGSKNAVKGLGFFHGAALLALAGFRAAIWAMAAVLATILLAVVLFLPASLPGRMKSEEAWGSAIRSAGCRFALPQKGLWRGQAGLPRAGCATTKVRQQTKFKALPCRRAARAPISPRPEGGAGMEL